jgi:hypothetical protein
MAAEETIREWNDLTADEQHRYRGNVDPWLGPIDPVAQDRWVNRWRREQANRRNEDPCGCWRWDCDECGHRMADGQRPRRGQAAAWWKRVLA